MPDVVSSSPVTRHEAMREEGRREGMQSPRNEGMKRVLQDLTGPEEVLRVTQRNA